MEPGDSFFSLRRFVRGKISKYELEDSDPLIYSVKPSVENLAQSKIYLEFDSFDKFGRALGLGDNDIWFYQAVVSPYGSGYDAYDYHQTEQDLFEGYGPWHDFNDENVELAQKIAKIYGKKFDYDDLEDRGNLAKILDAQFEREINDIVSDWTYEKNIEMNQVAKEHVESQINDVLKKYGFKLYGSNGISTSVADLISLFIQYNVPHLSISKLLKEVFRDEDRNIGGWDEDIYDYYDEKVFDKESFNRTVNRNLESILEKLTEDMEENSLKGFMNMIDNVTSKFRIGIRYELPKNKAFRFIIEGFDRDTKKIDITIIKPSGLKRRFKVSEDGFNKLLYQPELFNLDDL